MWNTIKRQALQIVGTLVLASLLGMGFHCGATPWPLGTLTMNSLTDPTCPAGFTCQGFAVSCPGVSNSIQGFLAIAPHQGLARGMVLFFTGNDGMGWWSTQFQELSGLADELRALGFTVAQARWSTSWLESSVGEEAGQAHLACRPATLIQFVHDHYYLPLGITNKRPGMAGFCVSGNSGGASQVSYALSHYGLKDILDVVVPTGGPPHSALAKSCMTNAVEKDYWFSLTTRQFIDRGFGYFLTNGPAAQHNPVYIPHWQAESIATGGNDFYYPATRVNFIVGENDSHMQTVASDYFDRLRMDSSPLIAFQIAPGTPHAVHSTDVGRTLIKAAILGLTLGPPFYASGQCSFAVNGVSNLTYIVEASENAGNWSSVKTNYGPFIFTDTAAGNFSSRVYRVTSQP